MSWYLAALKKYATFSGRARRKEFWMFTLFNELGFVALVALLIAAGIASDNAGREGLPNVLHQAVVIVFFLYWALTLLPGVAVQARRLHDTGKTGWYMLISLVPFVGGIILLVALCTEGNYGPNEYGPDPKRPAQPPVHQYA
jgi:uncharacterized membrane protein YhaH (DUF805 family)